MADEELEQEGASEEEGGKKKKGGGKLKLIIIIVVGVLLLGAGGFFGWQMFFAEEPPPPEKAAAEKAQADKDAKQAAAETKPPEGTVVNLEPFIVNLADSGGKRYLKLTLAVDAKEPNLKKAMQSRMPMIRDSVLLLLTSKTFKEVSTVTGKIRLRNEILKIMNRALSGVGSVHAVYFTEFMVQ